MAEREDQPRAFWRGARGVRKAELVSRHLSSSFVSRHYEVVRRLNSGSFAHVNLVRERETDQLRVCKVISTKEMDLHVLGMMRKEVQVLSALDHPNIVKLYEFAEDEKTEELVLILEYVAGGDCIDLLEEKERLLEENFVARLIHQLLVVMNYCHKRGITHRDVKPENVMLATDEETADCRVIDFGLATPYKGKVKEFAGTVSYLSPELAIEQAGFSMAADVWAVGATAFELLTGVAPFGKPQDFDNDSDAILEQLCDYEDFDQDLLDVFRQSPGHQQLWRSSEAKDFLRFVLKATPEDRPTAAEALEHRWLLRHRPEPAAITTEMLLSLAGFAEASHVHRGCLYALAAKGADKPTMESLGQAFVQADTDCDGQISKEDLAKAVAKAKSWWTWSREPEVDLDAVFKAADQDSLGFTEFAAMCLFGKHSDLNDELMDRAFAALDHDRDGQLRAEELQPIFKRHPQGLPKYHAFKRDEWCDCLMKEVEREMSEERAREEAARKEEKKQSEHGYVQSFIDRWLFAGCRAQQDADSEIDLGDEEPKNPKVERLQKEAAVRLPPALAASQMVQAAMASSPPDPVPVGTTFPALQAPKGLLPGPAGPGASFSSASTFSSLSSHPMPLRPSRSSHVLGH